LLSAARQAFSHPVCNNPQLWFAAMYYRSNSIWKSTIAYKLVLSRQQSILSNQFHFFFFINSWWLLFFINNNNFIIIEFNTSNTIMKYTYKYKYTYMQNAIFLKLIRITLMKEIIEAVFERLARFIVLFTYKHKPIYKQYWER